MASRAAVVKGTFLRPATSKNRRKYTSGNISSAVARMQERISSNGSLPISMGTGHAAANADDALATIGRVTKVDLDANGVATFEADIADTAAGRDIAALVTPENPYIKGVSIRGAWASQPYTITDDDGEESTTADDLEIKGIDFTWKPGVEGAEITSAEALAEAMNDPELIFESVDDATVFVDEANKAPYGDVKYADPGYQKDRKKRYPIDTAAHVRAAWAYINVAENSKSYSSNQLQRVKSKIKSAAKKFGIDIANESQVFIDELREVIEAYASVSWDNGQASLGVSGYTDDPTFLGPIVQRLAYGAMTALAAIDPDIDGDIDTQGASGPATSPIAVPGEDDPGQAGPAAQAVPDPSDGANHLASTSFGGEAAYGEKGEPDSDPHFSGRAGGIKDDLASAGGPTTTDTIECQCGESLDDTAMYCSQCGVPVAQAESTDSPTQENEESQMATPVTPVAPEAATPAVAETAPVATADHVHAITEAAEIVPARNLTDADTTALAGAFAAAIAPLLAPAVAAAPVEAAPVAAAPVVEAAPVATTPAVPAVEAAPVAESVKTYSATEVAEMLAQKELEATEAANLAAVEAFRAGPGARKGLVSTSQVTGVTEGDEIDYSKLSGADFMRAIAPVWESQPQRFASFPFPA